MLRVKISIKQQNISILGVYIVFDDKPYAIKDEEKNAAIIETGKTREIFLYYFNSRTIFQKDEKIIGSHDEHQMNNNRER